MKKMHLIATERLARLCLALASVHSRDCDYDNAIEWYQKALEISRTESTHNPLHEKALTGLGIATFYIGDTETAIESIQKAQSLSKKEVETGNFDQPLIYFVIYSYSQFYSHVN